MMKRLIPILLALIILTGCESAQPETTPVEASDPAAVQLSYMLNSTVEQQTDGAICAYMVYGQVEKLGMLDSGVVLQDIRGRLALLKGKDETVSGFSSLEMVILSVSGEEVIGYCPDTGEVYVLDRNLRQTASFSLEDGIVGTPVAGAETREVYYCTGGFIRALSLDTGLTRHVMEYVPEDQELNGCYFGGQLIGWKTEDKAAFLSSKDGQTVFQESNLLRFETDADQYYGIYLDGYVQQHIYGTTNGQPQQLLLDEGQNTYPQLQANCVITTENSDAGLLLRRYDLASGGLCGTVCAAISGEILDIAANESFTWILTADHLYRWEHALSAVEENSSYMIPLISAENPDTDGLASCAERAEQLGKAYGVEICLWQDALLNDDTYDITGEYQVTVINQLLDDLELEFPKLPRDIFEKTEAYCGIRICIVRQIKGQDFVQFRAQGGLCIAVTPAANLQEALLTGLGWGIDSRVIGNSRDLDYWNDMNPEGFNYDYSYFVNAQRTDLSFLEGEGRAFVDQRAMSFPSEDRARIFYYAMLEGNEELFSAPILQKKLKTFCEGIREAYGWQKEPQEFPWEQYLQESLTYKK